LIPGEYWSLTQARRSVMPSKGLVWLQPRRLHVMAAAVPIPVARRVLRFMLILNSTAPDPSDLTGREKTTARLNAAGLAGILSP
jgi:hypothetical protein